MRVCPLCLVGALSVGLSSTAFAQEAWPRPAPGPVVVVPSGEPVTVVTVLPPLPPAEAQPAPAPPIVIPLTPPSAPRSPRAWVHVQGGPHLLLEAVAPGETDWKPVCRAPCDVQVPLDALYRVTASGMQMSKSVHLEAGEGDRVVLDVDPTSEVAHAGGEALIILGGVGLIAGGVMLYADAVDAAACNVPGGGGCSASTALLWAGIGSAAVGAVALIGGIKMVQPTSLEQSTSGGEPRPGSARNDAWRRLPIWHESVETATAPRATTLPLLSGTF